MYRTLEIVTIGDSLTLGMNSSFGSIAQSYPDFLEGFLSGFLSLYLKNKVIKLLVVNQRRYYPKYASSVQKRRDRFST